MWHACMLDLHRRSVPVALCQKLPIRAARSEAELDALEAAYRIYDLYIWLSFRLEEGFPGRVAAQRERAAVAALFEEALPRLLPDPTAISRRCLPMSLFVCQPHVGCTRAALRSASTVVQLTGSFGRPAEGARLSVFLCICPKGMATAAMWVVPVQHYAA